MLTDCLIIFGICILIYADGSPMGYAYHCFIVSIIFSIIDWACSLRRLVSRGIILYFIAFLFFYKQIMNWPDGEVLLYNHSAAQVVYIDRYMTEPVQYTLSSSNSITIKSTYV